MIRQHHWLAHFAGCLVILTSAMPTLAASAADAEREIMRLEKECNDAYAANDLPKYFSYYADDAVLIFYNERTTVPAYHKMWTESIKTMPIASVKLGDMMVRVMPAGDTAIASYQIEVRTKHPDTKVTDEHAFETDVWIRRNGSWKLGHVHYSVKPSKTGGP